MRGLRSKTNAFYNAVSELFEYVIVALCETWLTDGINNSELFPNNYVVYRKDRSIADTGRSRGGGVLLAINNELKSTSVDLSQFCSTVSPYIDIVCCKIFLLSRVLYVFVLYLPPALTVRDYEQFFDNFILMDFIYDSNVLIIGDFNISELAVDKDRRLCKELNNFTEILNMQQRNNILNGDERLLDLVITNLTCVVQRDSFPLVAEDNFHPSLCIYITQPSPQKKFVERNKNLASYNFRRANYPLLYDALLNVDWSPLEDVSDINIACDIFYRLLYAVLDRFVPRFKNQQNRQYPPWFSQEIRKDIRCKERYFKRYRKFKAQADLIHYRRLRLIIKKKIITAYNTYIQQTEINIKTDSRKFWTFVKAKKGTSCLPGVITTDNALITDPQLIANAFGDYFSSVFSAPLQQQALNSVLPLLDVRMSLITENEIDIAIRKLKNKSTCGIDNIPSFLVKDCRIVFIRPLFYLYNLIFSSSTYPDVWKVARITAIHKSGDPCLLNNYRPISILCCFSKVFELLLFEQIYAQIKNYISQYQHGFVQGRSTITNLASFSEYVAQSLDKQGQVDVIYTDFSKAFDKLDHNLLLQKLHLVGFSGPLIQFFNSYLLSRYQFVEYKGFRSPFHKVSSGVPQGSNLGPLLFVMYINDLACLLKCNKLLYADDLKIFASIMSTDDCIVLQEQLNAIHEWCSLNNLPLNSSKCKAVSFSRKSRIISFSYTIKQTVIERCTSVKDLGIYFDNQYTFTLHMSNIVTEAVKILGFIIRNSTPFTSVDTIKLLYNSFVKSKLEYGSIIWYPIYAYQINLIESVQRKLAKYILYRLDGAYPPRGIDHSELLHRCHLHSLEIRRFGFSVTFLHKLLHNNLACPLLLSKIPFHVPRLHCRTHSSFYCKRNRTDIMLKSPIFVMCKNYNTIANLCDIHFDSIRRILNFIYTKSV